MRTAIPHNDVQLDYEQLINDFIEQIVKKQTSNLVSVFITGSYSRGDANEASDMDIWCIFRHLESEVLYDVGEAVNGLDVPYSLLEFNPQCFSKSEFLSIDFSSWSELSVKRLDSVLLYGEDIIGGEIVMEDIHQIYKKYLVDILMSIRHFMSTNTRPEMLTYKKLKAHVLKPLMFSLRLERYFITGIYPLKNSDLMEAYNDETREAIIYFLNSEALENDIKTDYKETMRKIHDIVVQLINGN